ncbi:MAG: nitroreductase family protein [Bifidobacterium tibiigranuli]|jgi:nitroreductase|uniref:nitroreductase family protein n=1 Tax=Bifidobacterium tibiigranuli TaxID=2172043 RepID=UPI0026EA6379|nr:nitroreductase family protein [Bifidobacterium tibiigranuli]MCI1674462.1 nitroreductase family protein [Bifidobacterium tibiigranuli]MCI1713888.1 nitroreductase family protein [Bifidobacterium tibiigranuli]MCI1834283.1 nitroreductase family protein [Bifidobacterium tibiigranuli]
MSESSSASEGRATPETVEILQQRRTIRKFADKPIEPDVVDAIEQAARQTATSESLSAWSVVRVKDPETRAEIARICGHARIARAPLLYVFLVDQHRNLRIAQELGVDPDGASLRSSNIFLQGYADAVLAVHATETAAEAFGLGAVILGSVHNDIPRIVELLHLPSNVFPVLGLGLGYPAKVPELKPRPPKKYQYFDDVYPDDAQTPSLVEALSQYDKDVHDYYERRNPDNPLQGFTSYVAALAQSKLVEQGHIFQSIADQGFRID